MRPAELIRGSLPTPAAIFWWVRHPTRWHVRSYGPFSANPFAQHDDDPALPDGTTTLKSAERLKLHHRFIFHTGDSVIAKIEAVWQEYSKETK